MENDNFRITTGKGTHTATDIEEVISGLSDAEKRRILEANRNRNRTNNATPTPGTPLPTQAPHAFIPGTVRTPAGANLNQAPGSPQAPHNPSAPQNQPEQNQHIESTIEQKVEETRTKYIAEYLKCKTEMGKKLKMERTRIGILNILNSAKNIFRKEKLEKKIFKEEDYFTQQFKNAKNEYDQSRKDWGNELYEKRKHELEQIQGITPEQVTQLLKEYRGRDILKKTIIDERQKLIDAKVEASLVHKPAWKRLLDAYRTMPRGKKILLSTLLFLPFTGAAALTAIVSTYGLAGAAGFVGFKFARSMISGTVAGHASLGAANLLYGKSNAQFKEDQAQAREELKNTFALGEINLDEYEKRNEALYTAERKRMRNQNIFKIGVSIAVAVAVSGTIQHEALGAVTDNLPSGGVHLGQGPFTSPLGQHHDVVTKTEFENNPGKYLGHHEHHHIHHSQPLPKPDEQTSQPLPDADHHTSQPLPDADNKVASQPLPDADDKVTSQPLPDADGTQSFEVNHDSLPLDDHIVTPRGELIDAGGAPGDHTNATLDIPKELGGGKLSLSPDGKVTTIPAPDQTASVNSDHLNTVAKPEDTTTTTTVNPDTTTTSTIGTGGKINIETHPHVTGTQEIREAYHGNATIAGVPDDNTLDHMPEKQWDGLTDQMIKDHGIAINGPQYENSRTLQLLFGHVERTTQIVDGKNVSTVIPDYYSDRPEWPTIEKIPAKYFFNSKGILDDPSHVSQSDLTMLKHAHILNDDNEFIKQPYLRRLMDAYLKAHPHETISGDQSISGVISKITTDLHKTGDGTLYYLKDNTHINVQGVNTNSLEFERNWGLTHQALLRIYPNYRGGGYYPRGGGGYSGGPFIRGGRGGF